jgi:integrase
MITFKSVVHAHRRRKDGTYPVTIRVTYGRKCRYLPTTITVTAADMTRSLKIKNPDVIAQTNALCDRLRSEASQFSPFDLAGRDVDWVVSRLTDAMRQQDFRLDFFAWADTYLQTKSDGNRPKYETALRAFERFLGKRAIDINEITHAMLLDFAEACDTGPKLAYSYKKGIVTTNKPRTGPISPQYLSRLSMIYEAAKDKYNDEDGGAVVIPRSPFRKLNMTPPKPTKGQKPVSVELLQQMIDAECSVAQRRALDVFIVGFALMGANIADLWEARPPKGRWWAYNRRKTRDRRADGAFIRCEVAHEIGPFMARLGVGTKSEWWLPVLHDAGKNASVAGQTVNRGLRSWCEKVGIEQFTFYACRHTWATLARRIGVEKATVDEALGHVGDFRVADIYAERDWERIAEANRKVLALFRW